MFEIPVVDLDRSIDFYQKVFETAIRKISFLEITAGLISNSKLSPNGMLVKERNQSHFAARTIIISIQSNNVMNRLLKNAFEAGASVIPEAGNLQNIQASGFEDVDGNIVSLIVSQPTTN